MSRSRRNTEGLLARVNFPLYSLQMLTSRHVLVAGGGGSAKTGVANGFVSSYRSYCNTVVLYVSKHGYIMSALFLVQEVFEITYDGKRYVAKEVVRHETGPKVVMNCAAYSNNKYTYLAAGQEGHCQLYKVLITVEKEGTAGSDEVNKGIQLFTSEIEFWTRVVPGMTCRLQGMGHYRSGHGTLGFQHLSEVIRKFLFSDFDQMWGRVADGYQK